MKIVALYLSLIVLAVASLSVSALGGNNCLAVMEKRRGSMKEQEEQDVILASYRGARAKATQRVDTSAQGGRLPVSSGRRTPSPRPPQLKNDWERLIDNAIPVKQF